MDVLKQLNMTIDMSICDPIHLWPYLKRIFYVKFIKKREEEKRKSQLFEIPLKTSEYG